MRMTLVSNIIVVVSACRRAVAGVCALLLLADCVQTYKAKLVGLFDRLHPRRRRAAACSHSTFLAKTRTTAAIIILQLVVEILGIKLLYAAVLFREEYSCKMEDDKLFTTNAQDVQNVANLQARLTDSSTSSINKDGSTTIKYDDIPTVSIDNGAYKYVLISAVPPSPTHSSSNLPKLFVYSKRGAKYHVNVAEYLIPQLESSGYTNIQVKGGGRILRDDVDKKIHIFGYSYGFGMADHAKSKEVVERCTKYEGYDITWSNDGY